MVYAKYIENIVLKEKKKKKEGMDDPTVSRGTEESPLFSDFYIGGQN